MAMRIRTVKPELYRHRDLFDLERETQLPMRLAWTGLPAICDREGRFEWRPETIKLDILPFDDLDFSWVLDAFAARGFITKYRRKPEPDQSTETHVQARAEKCFGFIPTFLLHQRPNLREAKSVLPALDSKSEVIAVPFPTIPARTETHVQDPGEGKGRGRGRGKEGEGEKSIAGAIEKFGEAGRGVETDPSGASSTALAWRAYRDAFEAKYKSRPPWNAKIAGQLKSFVSRIPAQAAPEVAAFYLTHPGARYVGAMHPVGHLLMDAEKLYTEWQTGMKVTATGARQAEKMGHAQEQMRRIREGTL